MTVSLHSLITPIMKNISCIKWVQKFFSHTLVIIVKIMFALMFKNFPVVLERGLEESWLCQTSRIGDDNVNMENLCRQFL